MCPQAREAPRPADRTYSVQSVVIILLDSSDWSLPYVFPYYLTSPESAFSSAWVRFTGQKRAFADHKFAFTESDFDALARGARIAPHKEDLMSAPSSTAKPYKGLGMEGVIARWNASCTKKSLEEFRALARRTAERIPPQSSVLEVASGPGYFAIELAKLGNYQITGLDISETFVGIARANAAKAGVRVGFRHGNASNMPFAKESFNFLLCRAAFKNFSSARARKDASRSEAWWTSADHRSARRRVSKIDQPGCK